MTYRPEDIDLDNNPIHKYLHGMLLAQCIIFMLTADKFKQMSNEEIENQMKKNTADFLQGLADKGIALVLQEHSIPQVFREGY